MNSVSALSRSRQNYLIIDQLFGHLDWDQAAEIPTRVGYHDGRKIKVSILKIGNHIKSCVGFHNEKYVVLRVNIDQLSYDLKLHPSEQDSFVWVYFDGVKRYDVRKTESVRVLKRQKALSIKLHVSLKKLLDGKVKLAPRPGARIGPSVERRKGQKYDSPQRRITD